MNETAERPHIDRAREAIESERKRQIEVEGWDAAHDDAHDSGELLRAANCYYLETMRQNSYREDGCPLGWPWDKEWWKPKGGTTRNLVVAGALAMAERDRLRRARENVEPAMHKLRIYIAALGSRLS